MSVTPSAYKQTYWCKYNVHVMYICSRCVYRCTVLLWRLNNVRCFIVCLVKIPPCQEKKTFWKELLDSFEPYLITAQCPSCAQNALKVQIERWYLAISAGATAFTCLLITSNVTFSVEAMNKLQFAEPRRIQSETFERCACERACSSVQTRKENTKRFELYWTGLSS